MAFKMKGSPMKRNFGIGASPAKFKLKYPKEEYTKRGFDPNMFSVRDGKVIKDGKYVCHLDMIQMILLLLTVVEELMITT